MESTTAEIRDNVNRNGDRDRGREAEKTGDRRPWTGFCLFSNAAATVPTAICQLLFCSLPYALCSLRFAGPSNLANASLALQKTKRRASGWRSIIDRFAFMLRRSLG